MAMTRSSDSLGALAGDLLGMKTSGALFLGILSSRTVEDRIIAQFNLRAVYRVTRMEQARKQLEASTFMTEDRKSGIIAITVTDRDPQRATAMGKAYVDELDRLVVELNTSTAHRERVFLEQRLQTIKQDLDQAARDFSEFASKNAALDIKEQGKATMEAAAVLEGQLIAAQSEREGLRQIYSDENVRVRALGAKIAELQKSLDQIGGGTPDSAVSSKSADSAYPSLRKLPLLGVTYAELFRRSKVEETLYDVLTQQYEFAKVQEAKETPSVRVLDPPSVPEKKSFPPRLLIGLLGAVLSFAFGVVWLLAGDVWRETDSQNPAKAFLQDVYTGVKTDLRLVSSNGSRLGHLRDKILKFKSHE
jgi:capsule polysaccharide export protein KpsE/RkpR